MRKKNKKGGKVVRAFSLSDGPPNISGKRIREARQRLGLSQEALAAKLQLHGLQITQYMVCKIERGNRYVLDYELSVFAEVLNVTTDSLLERDTPNE